ncbi:hypothetical protein M501DRAFT_465905 [Patellaria atrata CBS 101060]|uniref:Integral membrane bound transporter domain-containing protein n=1 Tax=Patellaria atrata CBS 101060 TaxID=1346257 RepID=A0A9P4VL52_9PEZI|nr:hypothetical protein M501DRAFT_465905 [Patellaria atrata CBS 101060]
MDARDLERRSPSPSRQFLRPGLRNATLILPRTGERVKRAFTLRGSIENVEDVDQDDEETPLLGWDSDAQDKSLYQRGKGRMKKELNRICNFATSTTGFNIFKCSIAYFLGSMATFVPAIAATLGQNDGKHMVATITVYFHAARSAGSMIEATILALLAFAYAAFISFTSMGVSIFFADRGLLVLGHIIVLIVFCGGGLGLVALAKQKLGHPLVNVACSLASLAIITVLTKEGAVQAAQFSDDKVVQVLKMVIMGITIATAVNLLIGPVSARKALRNDFVQTTDSLGDMLTMITRSFLSGDERKLSDPSFLDASKKFNSCFTSLTKNLAEAKYEHYLLGEEKEYQIERRLVRCMEQLEQDIGGLRSAATTQFALIATPSGQGAATPVTARSWFTNAQTMSSPEISPSLASADRTSYLDSIVEEDEESEMNSRNKGGKTAPSLMSIHSGNFDAAITPGDVFTTFIHHLGPSMKSLAFTLKAVLDELPFGPPPDFSIVVNRQFRCSLIDANELFTHSRVEALQMLYKTKVLDATRTINRAADYEDIAASCGYFSSALQDFAEDMIKYLDILEELQSDIEKPRSWNWLLPFWRQHQTELGNPEPDRVTGNPESGLSQSIPAVHELHKVPENPEQPIKRKFIFSARLWKLLGFFRRTDVKFAIKVGFGAVLYAMWSFIPSTRPFYSHWRGEWGLLSYMLVCSMTIGSANSTGYQRISGTCLGAVIAILFWAIGDENPYVLAFLGWITSLGGFYIIVGRGKGPMGRYILLTYNLSVLYAYSLSVKDSNDDDDEGGISPEIWEITLHRVVAVMVGCAWGIIVTRLVWPISARRRLKDGLCLLWLRMGLIWKRDPLEILLDGGGHRSYMDIREALELRRFLCNLQALKGAASNEFELKGSFPAKIFSRILEATERMLDAFHAMKVLIEKDLKASPGEIALLRYTKEERRQLSARISHLFSVMASSMKLEYPLSDAMPNIDHTRDRFLAKTFHFRKSGAGDGVATDADYELLYAYALVTGQLADEIQCVAQCIEELYGVLDEDNLKLQ